MQALAIGLRFLGLALGVGRKRTWTIVLIATLAYALLVGLMPSVVRSAAMTAVFCIGELLDLPSRRANLLAAAALVTLGLNPSHLFDVGCQLSFVAVAAIYWGPDFLGRLIGLDTFIQYLNRRVSLKTIIAPFELNDPLFRLLPAIPARLTRRGLAAIFGAVWVSTTVWLATAPLTALRFHTLSPIGILLNIPLIPLTTLALFAAGAALVLSAIWTPLGVPAGWICGRLLEWTERLTLFGVSVPFGHAFTPAPSGAWVLGFFFVLAAAIVIERKAPKMRISIIILLVIYIIFGIWSTIAPRKPKALEVEVLAVGHGLAVLIQDVDGRVILYDCGKMGDPRVGRRTIAPAVWSRGVRRIEAVVLSHADADHYDALPDLLDRFAIGAIFTPPGFFDERLNRGIDALRGQIQARRIPLKTLVNGDRLALAKGATIDVLHPPIHWLDGIPDNARCVVLDVAGEHHHMLLTGDLEGIGLARLIDRPRREPIDAMLAPHHGGGTANPAYLYDWAVPKAVIVSQRRPISGARDALEPIAARGVRLLRTWEVGAIRARFGPDEFTLDSFKQEQQSHARESKEMLDSMIYSIWFQIIFGIIFFLIGLIWSLILAMREGIAWSLIVPSLNAAHEGSGWDEGWSSIETRAARRNRLAGLSTLDRWRFATTRGAIVARHGRRPGSLARSGALALATRLGRRLGRRARQRPIGGRVFILRRTRGGRRRRLDRDDQENLWSNRCRRDRLGSIDGRGDRRSSRGARAVDRGDRLGIVLRRSSARVGEAFAAVALAVGRSFRASNPPPRRSVGERPPRAADSARIGRQSHRADFDLAWSRRRRRTARRRPRSPRRFGLPLL